MIAPQQHFGGGIAKALILCFQLALTCTAANAQPQSKQPLPPVRPPALSPQAPHPAPSTPASPPSAPKLPSMPDARARPTQPEDTATCLARLAAAGVKAEAVPTPPLPLTDCGIDGPLRLSSITLASGAILDLPDRPILGCAFATVFADFAKNVIAPLGASMLGSPIASLSTGPGFECRGRNGVASAKTSAHGMGKAIDLATIVLADHRRIAAAGQASPEETLFVQTMRRAACGWFTTVLGPGADAAHAEHFHFDIARHGNSDFYRICE
jgi:hypothetical protein